MTEPAPLTPHQRLTALYTLAGYGRQSAKFATDLLAEHDAQAVAGKDIRGGTQPPANASTLSSDVLGILSAIHEALDVPLPGLDAADERAYHRLMERRISSVRSTLGAILDLPGNLLDFDAKGIRKDTASNPVTYTAWKSAAERGERP